MQSGSRHSGVKSDPHCKLRHPAARQSQTMSWHADENYKVQQEEAVHTRCQQGRGMQMNMITSGNPHQMPARSWHADAHSNVRQEEAVHTRSQQGPGRQRSTVA